MKASCTSAAFRDIDDGLRLSVCSIISALNSPTSCTLLVACLLEARGHSTALQRPNRFAKGAVMSDHWILLRALHASSCCKLSCSDRLTCDGGSDFSYPAQACLRRSLTFRCHCSVSGSSRLRPRNPKPYTNPRSNSSNKLPLEPLHPTEVRPSAMWAKYR